MSTVSTRRVSDNRFGHNTPVPRRPEEAMRDQEGWLGVVVAMDHRVEHDAPSNGRGRRPQCAGFDECAVSPGPPSLAAVRACVFITMGPCHATGSSIGAPEIRRNRTPSGPACTVTSSPVPKRISVRSPDMSRMFDLLSHDLLFQQHAGGRRSVRERPRPLKHIGKGAAVGVDPEGFLQTGRHRHI